MKHGRSLIILFFLNSLLTANGQSVESILEKYYTAVGGTDKLDKLKSSSVKTTSTMSSQMPMLLGEWHSTTSVITESLYPYFTRTQSESIGHSRGGTRKSLYINNEKASYNIDKLPHEYSTRSNPNNYCSVHPALEFRLLSEKGLLTVGADTVILTQKCSVIRSVKGKFIQKFYFRKSDGLLIASMYRGFHELTTFADYRMVDGIAFPFKQENFSLKMDHRSSSIVEHVEFNVALTPSYFDVDESKLEGLRDSELLRSKVEFLPENVESLSISDLIKTNFNGKRVLIYPWSSTCDRCKFEFLNYDGNFYSFLWELKISLLFLNLDDESKRAEWEASVKTNNLIGKNMLASPASPLHNEFMNTFFKSKQIDSARYVLFNQNGDLLSENIKSSLDENFKSQLRRLLQQQ